MRRTARTHLAALGVRSEVAERCLGHKLLGVEGTYNRHDYFKERRMALEQWTQLLVQAEAGDSYVVPFRQAGNVGKIGHEIGQIRRHTEYVPRAISVLPVNRIGLK